MTEYKGYFIILRYDSAWDVLDANIDTVAENIGTASECKRIVDKHIRDQK